MTQVDITEIDRDFFGFRGLWSEFTDIRGHCLPSIGHLYGCYMDVGMRHSKGWADGITGSSEVNSGSSALPGLEAQQSTYESKRSSFSLNSFFAGASSTLAGCVTTKPRIDVASFDQLQSGSLLSGNFAEGIGQGIVRQ